LRRAAFIDRDGTIDELVPDPVTGEPEGPLRARDVALLPGAAAALRDLSDAGWLLIGVSNQPAAAKAKATLEELAEVQALVLQLLEAEGVRFDDFRLCMHHPAGVVPELTASCQCRKPAPGMLLEAAAPLGVDLEASWMIGDTDSDVEAGKAAGCRTVLIEHPPSAHKRSGDAAPDATAPDLAAAIRLLLAPDRVN
jgi:D-glycero-D-manno-heptose 1,7-bisphosphate phosphatase